MYIIESLCCTAEINITNQLYFNKKNLKMKSFSMAKECFVHQRSPTFLAPGDQFRGRQCFHRWGGTIQAVMRATGSSR